MGMYTEVVFRCEVNEKKLGTDVFNIFKYMFNSSQELNGEDLKLPDHEFFKCPRWDSIGSCSSFYHHPNAVKDWYIPYYVKEEYPDVHIFSRSDLKNYDNEIDKFFDWVDSLGIFYKGSFMGYSLYEEDNNPKIFISKKDTK